MNGTLFREIMRGPYIGGEGYKGWDEEHAKSFVADFASVIPKVDSPALKKNSKSYTLTWSEGKVSFKALFTLEEDAFGGPCYRYGDVVVLSCDVSSQAAETKKEEKKDAKKEKAEKEEKKGAEEQEETAKEVVEEAVEEVSKGWSAVENSASYLESHVRPLFYYLCLQSPPKGIVFL